MDAAVIIGVLAALALVGLGFAATRTAAGRSLVRWWVKRCYRLVVGAPVTEDPARKWKGTAQADQAELRIMHVGDCGMRAMETSHDFYAPLGFPKFLAERLLDENVGIEFGHYFTIVYETLPDIARLRKVTKLSADPDVILINTGATYQRRVILKSSERINQLRLEVGRRLGRNIFTAHRLLVRPFVRRLGRHWNPYDGTELLDHFVDGLEQAWPDAKIVVIAPFPLEWAYPTCHPIHERVIADARELAERRGLPFLDFAELLSADGLHCANGYNLNSRGSELLGDELATWVLNEVVRGSAPAIKPEWAARQLRAAS